MFCVLYRSDEMKYFIVFSFAFFSSINCQPLQFPARYPTIGAQNPYYPSSPDFGQYVGPPLSNSVNYNPDTKWPAYGMDAPGNYNMLGKYNNGDAFLNPPGIPRWYGQPIGGGFFKHTPFFNWNPYVISGSTAGKK